MKFFKVIDSFLYFCVSMRLIRTILVFISFALFASGLKTVAQEREVVVPYTLADRDRVIQIEAMVSVLSTRIDALDATVNIRFEDQQRQLSDLKTLFYWGFGIMLSLFLFMFGYIVWDRRTAMKPALQQAARAMEDNRQFITILRDYSKKHPDLAEILRMHGLL